MNSRRLLARRTRGETANVRFSELIQLLLDLGFRETGGRGSHRILTRLGVNELVNLQNVNGDAKQYQVRQIASIIRRYNLVLEVDS